MTAADTTAPLARANAAAPTTVTGAAATPRAALGGATPSAARTMPAWPPGVGVLVDIQV